MGLQMTCNFVLLLLIGVVVVVPADNTTSEGDARDLAELELELEQQEPLEQSVSRRGSGWSGWSRWSVCSRSCDGGVSYQLRSCKPGEVCSGEPVRYKICNMQPCPDANDFREQQCQSFEREPYEGVWMRWRAHWDSHAPCALTCRGYPDSERSRDIGDEPSQSLDEPPHIVVKLAEIVQDGTRCRHGSLDMCIDGRCQQVGCDLQIGSGKRVDECGVCGGDGSSCSQPLYHWEEAAASLCSVTCGGGYKMSRPMCRNRVTGAEVDESLCNAAKRPQPKLAPCNTHKCPAKWMAGEWAGCSTSCGGGIRLRQVSCIEVEIDGNFTKVLEPRCPSPRPHTKETCNPELCPEWAFGEWTVCSVTCGGGTQSRAVYCRDAEGSPSARCDPISKPKRTRPCHEPPCQLELLPEVFPEGGDPSGLESWNSHTQPLVQPYPPQGVSRELTKDSLYDNHLRYEVEEWGPCNVTCGQGFRTRPVKCMMYLEYSRTWYPANGSGNCQGLKKPEDTEFCEMPSCNDWIDDSPSPKIYPGETADTYSWKKMGFTHCSASCLGGVQESLILCVRDRDQRSFSPFLCTPETKPETMIQTCNDHPCPPRWNYSDFQVCTHSCGIGIQTREVNCIHEVTRGGINTVIVPNNMCPQPPPSDRQFCNILDCPIKWHVSEWSKCSKPCGGGVKVRSVECKQIMAQNKEIPRPNQCAGPRPADRKPCNTKACAAAERPHISLTNNTYIQSNPGKRKITLKVGGQAVVYRGTQVKIKCPVKKFNRTRIHWQKDRSDINNSNKYRISKKGALRIQDVTQLDTGIYTCIAGRSQAELTLTVRPRPGEFPSSEEIERHNANLVPTRHGNQNQGGSNTYDSPLYDSARGYMSPTDDLSHELRPGDGSPLSLLPMPQGGGGSSFQHRPPPPPPPPTPHQTPPPPMPPSPARDLNRHPTPPTRQQVPEVITTRQPPRHLEPGQTSAASRPMPHFQQLLVNLQSFGSSRGHRALVSEGLSPAAFKEEFSAIAEDAVESEETAGGAGGNEEEDGFTTEGYDSIYGTSVILGKGSPENVKFEWVITDWSKCSHTCGGTGFQVRGVQCVVRLHNVTQHVEASLCEDAGLTTPPTVERCGTEVCSQWQVGEWTACEDSRCFTWNTAMQRREVVCKHPNGSEADGSLCADDERPPQRQECYNDRCRPTWKTGDWFECAAECEAQGVKYRLLQCVWFGTKKPAGNACRDQPRPSVMKLCKGPPCLHALECKDHSSYCRNVRAMQLCRMHRYRAQCCHTCRSAAAASALSPPG